MGDIVHLPSGGATLEVSVEAPAPIERVEVFDGERLLQTFRTFAEADLGRRIRVLWEGATYRGRAREVVWDGSATVSDDTIESAALINFFNPDKTLDRVGDTVSWRSLTTGNFGGFDLVLAHGTRGEIDVRTPVVDFGGPIAAIGLQDTVRNVPSELPTGLRLFRLPILGVDRDLRFEIALVRPKPPRRSSSSA